MSFPQNITIKPRENQFVNAFGSESRASVAHIYYDMTCDFVGFNRTDRDALESYHGWEAYGWLSEIGLSGLIGRQIKTPAHSFQGEMLDTHWLSQSSVNIELQTARDDYPLVCVDAKTWPSTLPCGTSLKSINLQPVDHYKYMSFASGRQRRTKKLLGSVSTFRGELKFSVEEFAIFVNWYRCFVSNGGGAFNANWLNHKELGLWAANFSEPWEAKLSDNQWLVTINLILVVNRDLDYLSTIRWYVEQALAETTQASIDICTLTNGYLVPITQTELDATLVAKTAICTATTNAINTLS